MKKILCIVLLIASFVVASCAPAGSADKRLLPRNVCVPSALSSDIVYFSCLGDQWSYAYVDYVDVLNRSGAYQVHHVIPVFRNYGYGAVIVGYMVHLEEIEVLTPNGAATPEEPVAPSIPTDM